MNRNEKEQLKQHEPREIKRNAIPVRNARKRIRQLLRSTFELSDDMDESFRKFLK